MKEPIEEIKQWLTKADHDFGTAKITYLHIPEYLDTVIFHCQQAVEKSLKSYLIFLQLHFKLTHDLVYLLDLITQIDAEFEQFYDLVSELQGCAVEIRYPNETIFLTNEKIENGFEIAKAIRDFVTLKMNINVDYNEIID